MTEFGSLALVDEGAGDGDGVNISLPGVRRGTTRPAVIKYNNILFLQIEVEESTVKSRHFTDFYLVHLFCLCIFTGDMSSRHFKPEIRVSSLRFSPTGR